MRVIKNKTSNTPVITSLYDIAYNTNIGQGAIVTLSASKVVAQAVNGTAAILGIAAEQHTGADDPLNFNNDATRILVADSPTAIYEGQAVEIAATGGSTTTIISTSGFADESGSDTFVDNDFIGGYAKLTYKGSSSTNTDPIGTVYSISDSDAGDKSLTINTAGGAVTAGDKFKIFPPLGFQKGNLNTGRTDVVYTAVVALPFKVCGYNLEKETVEYYPTLHFYGNDDA